MRRGRARPLAERRVLILGAGPAGLTAGYLLAQRGLSPTVVEADEQVGGLAKTVTRDGYRFDLGGHRFFTKSQEVSSLWHEILGGELLVRRRLSRIYWRGRFLRYPLKGSDVVRELGPVELARVLASYLEASVRSSRQERSFEQWVVNRFGRRLFELFFETYTEKVWGVPPSEIRAEWAAQRIKGLSLRTAALAAMAPNRSTGVRSLIDEFRYPRLGPGQMWETMADRIETLGGRVLLGTPVRDLRVAAGRVYEIETTEGALPAEEVISSLPLRALVGLLSCSPPAAVVDAARGLRYRDFLTVALVLRGDSPFPDNWIYVHEPAVRVARIQNYGAWSPAMVPDPSTACLGLEYFCFEGDELWTLADSALVALAVDELEALGLGVRDQVESGYVVRVPRAYPMYDGDYSARTAVIRDWLDRFANLQQIGRNGLHRYNNSDHSMLTALRAVENLVHGTTHDIWAINTESAYHEEAEGDEHPYRDAPETPAMSQPLAAH